MKNLTNLSDTKIVLKTSWNAFLKSKSFIVLKNLTL